MHISFIHPDLGIGGAERLVCDAALAAQQYKHTVAMYTSHHDRKHCFPETANGQLDQLLTKRETPLKSIYRAPLDWLEERTTGLAHCLLVNSKFTESVLRKTFKSLSHANVQVFYPSLHTKSFDKPVDAQAIENELHIQSDTILFLSLNRFERKKNLSLAVRAFEQLQSNAEDFDESTRSRLRLILAGGYDDRCVENVEHFAELAQLVDERDMGKYVQFLRSPSDDVKLALLRRACAVIYTPDNEHFGIVPLESMYSGATYRKKLFDVCLSAGTPCVAVASGGPMETVVNAVTGFLCAPTPDAFAVALAHIVRMFVAHDRTMNVAAKAHVSKHFSFDAFARQMNNIVCNL